MKHTSDSARALSALPRRRLAALRAAAMVISLIAGASMAQSGEGSGARSNASSSAASAGRTGTSPPAAGQTRPALSVTTTSPVREKLAVRLPANGSVAAWDEAPIGTETVGLRLIETRVSVGDVVRRGDVLAVFASATLEAELAQTEAGVSEAQAQWAEARDNAGRARSLLGTDALSATQLAQYLSAEQIARARLQGAHAQLQGVRARLAQTRVVAPDAGIISARQASVGSVPQPGQELFRLIRQGRIEWRAEVTSEELLRLKPGSPAQLLLPGGEIVTGRVRLLAPSVDSQTRNAIVHVDIPPMSSADSARLRPGMFVRGSFELGEVITVVVAQSAIAMRDGFSYVFRIEPDQRVTQLRIQTGRIAADRVEVISGLKGDEILVGSGAGFLNDGDQIRIVPASGVRR